MKFYYINTGKYIQYPGVNHSEKEYIYIYINESLRCTAEINIVNQLYFKKFLKIWSLTTHYKDKHGYENYAFTMAHFYVKKH